MLCWLPTANGGAIRCAPPKRSSPPLRHSASATPRDRGRRFHPKEGCPSAAGPRHLGRAEAEHGSPDERGRLTAQTPTLQSGGGILAGVLASAAKQSRGGRHPFWPRDCFVALARTVFLSPLSTKIRCRSLFHQRWFTTSLRVAETSRDRKSGRISRGIAPFPQKGSELPICVGCFPIGNPAYQRLLVSLAEYRIPGSRVRHDLGYRPAWKMQLRLALALKSDETLSWKDTSYRITLV